MAATAALRSCKQQPAAELFHACSLPRPIPAGSLHLSHLISCFFPPSSSLQQPHTHIHHLLEHLPTNVCQQPPSLLPFLLCFYSLEMKAFFRVQKWVALPLQHVTQMALLVISELLHSKAIQFKRIKRRGKTTSVPRCSLGERIWHWYKLTTAHQVHSKKEDELLNIHHRQDFLPIVDACVALGNSPICITGSPHRFMLMLFRPWEQKSKI